MAKNIIYSDNEAYQFGYDDGNKDGYEYGFMEGQQASMEAGYDLAIEHAIRWIKKHCGRVKYKGGEFFLINLKYFEEAARGDYESNM